MVKNTNKGMEILMDKWIRLLFMILLIYNMLYDIILTLKQSGHSEFKRILKAEIVGLLLIKQLCLLY